MPKKSLKSIKSEVIKPVKLKTGFKFIKNNSGEVTDLKLTEKHKEFLTSWSVKHVNQYKINLSMIDKLVKALKTGTSIKTACSYLNFSDTYINVWKNHGLKINNQISLIYNSEELTDKQKEIEAKRLIINPIHFLYYLLYLRIVFAVNYLRLKCEEVLQEAIEKKDVNSVNVAQWLLVHKYQNEYTQKGNNSNTNNIQINISNKFGL